LHIAPQRTNMDEWCECDTPKQNPSEMKFVNNRFELAATDLSNHLGCNHLTELNRKLALREIEKPTYYDKSLEVLQERGRKHEAAYVEYLKSSGLEVVDLKGKPQDATIEAMKRGAAVIVQARLADGDWMGFSDVLVRVAGKSDLGDYKYDVHDTKLSQNTKASTILQLCLYADLLTRIQGAPPDNICVVKPGADFPTERYPYAEFQSYYALVKNNFEAIIAQPSDTYPEKKEQCNICRWWQVCDKQRHDDDHLSLVAGLRSSSIIELEKQRIDTLAAFANAVDIARPERGNLDSLLSKQQQAKIQLDGRIENALKSSFRDVENGRGLNRLPEPNAGDVYFDIEGDMHYEGGSLEYLFGWVYLDNEKSVYQKVWATTRAEEKAAFETFMTFISERWKKFPGMHIYHFAPYEPSALKRLAHLHATKENDLHTLLRAERLIDLHAVFKEGLLASVETYSLKALEKFTTYAREVPLQDASVARKHVEVALETNSVADVSSETLDIVTQYNADDCFATEALHRWLENKRAELINEGKSLTRPELKTGELTNEDAQNDDTRAQALFNSLIAGLPEDRTTWSDEQKAKWLLAHQVDYFRREDKSAWWEFFRVHELDHEGLIDERKAITGLTFISVLPKKKGEQNITHQYSFPPQEVDIDTGDKLTEVKGKDIGTVRDISLEKLTIDIKKRKDSADIHPKAVHVSERVDPGSLAKSLMDIAADIVTDGFSREWRYRAAKDLLMKRNPTLLKGEQGAHVREGEDVLQAAVRIALNLDRSVLAIQGPPGSGKTFTGATIIAELVKAGKKVGITAVSHKVIRNLVDATIERSKELGIKVSFVHKPKEKSDHLPDELQEVDKSQQVRDALQAGKVGCGTAWLWAEDNSEGSLEYLFVDEAGQMSLSQVLAASRAANNLILLGDPQQLEQPTRGAHPEGSDVAALTYLIDGNSTMPEGRGLFIHETRRLHPAICRFTSEIFYNGKLKSFPGLEHQAITGGTSFDGSGLRYVPVVHRGCQSRSMQEVDAVEKIVTDLLRSGSWTNSKGETQKLTPEDIKVVAPFNAQVAALRDRLPAIEIGTVDKFQGQEAPVVIYSMTSSTVEDAPRGMKFLFSPNRLNVATSRARCLCILVANPLLLQPECRTIDQMRWANALCRYLEISGVR